MQYKDKQDFIICVDMDDTIEYLCEAWVNWLNNKYDLSVNYKEITSWKLDSFFPSLTKNQIISALYDSDFWYTVKPKEDAMFYLKKLYDEGFTIYICTAAHYRTCKPKMEALIERYFSFIDWKHIISCANKQMIKCDVLVDDATHNLIGGDYIKVLMNTQYNGDIDAEENGMIRAFSWEDVYNIIHKYYNVYHQLYERIIDNGKQ